MPCGQYCYQRKWQCQGGRLRQLTNVQKQPGPTRNYGSEGARQNSIRRRVMSVKTTGSKTNYGPLFGGKKKPSVFSNCGFCGDRSVEEGKNVYYNNGGTSGTNTYWNKIAAGPKGVKGMTCCCQDEQTLTIDWSAQGGAPTEAAAVGMIVSSLPPADVDMNAVAVGPIVRVISGGAGADQWIIVVNVRLDYACVPAREAMAVGDFDNADEMKAGGLALSPFGAPGWTTTVPSEDGTITATPPQGPCDKNRLCGGDNGTTLLGGAKCSLGGRNWLNYRRFHPGAAKA